MKQFFRFAKHILPPASAPFKRGLAIWLSASVVVMAIFAVFHLVVTPDRGATFPVRNLEFVLNQVLLTTTRPWIYLFPKSMWVTGLYLGTLINGIILGTIIGVINVTRKSTMMNIFPSANSPMRRGLAIGIFAGTAITVVEFVAFMVVMPGKAPAVIPIVFGTGLYTTFPWPYLFLDYGLISFSGILINGIILGVILGVIFKIRQSRDA